MAENRIATLLRQRQLAERTARLALTDDLTGAHVAATRSSLMRDALTEARTQLQTEETRLLACLTMGITTTRLSWSTVAISHLRSEVMRQLEILRRAEAGHADATHRADATRERFHAAHAATQVATRFDESQQAARERKAERD